MRLASFHRHRVAAQKHLSCESERLPDRVDGGFVVGPILPNLFRRQVIPIFFIVPRDVRDPREAQKCVATHRIVQSLPLKLETHALVGAPIVVTKSSPADRVRFVGLGRVADFTATDSPVLDQRGKRHGRVQTQRLFVVESVLRVQTLQVGLVALTF